MVEHFYSEIPWPKGKTHDDLFKLYLLYIKERYGQNVTVIFEGYSDGPNTKDVTRMRRSKTPGPNVSFESGMPCNIKKRFPVQQCKQANFKVHHTSWLFLARQGIQSALCKRWCWHSSCFLSIGICRKPGHCIDRWWYRSFSTTNLSSICQISITQHLQEPEWKALHVSKKPTGIWNIKETVEVLGCDVYSLILILHAWFGCDTISRIQGFGKG